MFRNRFLALRRGDRLDDAERLRLEALFNAHAELARAWGMLQELHGLYLAEDEAGAMEASTGSPASTRRTPYRVLYKVVDTLLKWGRRSSPSTRAGRISNGRPEGTNNKPGVLNRMAFGFVNASNFEARGLLLCPPRPVLS